MDLPEPSEPPRLSARAVLVDVDETITHIRDEGYMFGVLFESVAEARNVDLEAAQQVVREVFDPQQEDPDRHLDALGVDRRRFRERLVERARALVEPYADAVAMLRALRARGFELYPATSNGSTSCLTKLSVAGLADPSGLSCFDELFGGSEVSPAGKTGPDFYRALLGRIGAVPEDVVMVGDDPLRDLADARGAGIEQVVLPRRGQASDWVLENDGGLYLRSLETLPSLLRKTAGDPHRARL